MARDEVVHTFDVMGALEGLSGQLACQHITAVELAAIKELHRQMAACHRKRDLPGYYRLNRAIHERINEAARNPVLTRVYRAVNARLHALRFRSNFDRAKWDAALAEHEQMLVALEKRDGERMRRILVEHLAKKCAAALLAVMGPEPTVAVAGVQGGRKKQNGRRVKPPGLPAAARSPARVAPAAQSSRFAKPRLRPPHAGEGKRTAALRADRRDGRR